MKPEQLVLFERYADAVGADRYRVTSIKLDEINGEKKALILDKKDGVSRGFTRAEVAQHMPELLSLLRRGENIYYTPLSENKHHILVDDVRDFSELKRDGFRLSVVIESSPNNFQAIITIPKLGVPQDREIANYLSSYLNQSYGDRKFFGCIHPHRAPGFKNFKLKYRDEHGNFPTVKLVECDGGECEKTFELSRSIYQQNKEVDIARGKVELRNERLPEIEESDESLSAALMAYMAHYYHITVALKSRMQFFDDDFSRYDSMIALRMRATGHSKQAIAHAIEVMGPTIRIPYKPKPDRNWADYARRTAEYAFSQAAERRLADLQRYWKDWIEFERRFSNSSSSGG